MPAETNEPKVVGIEVIRKAGVDVDNLIEEPVKGVAAELTTNYYYRILPMHLTGMEGEVLKGIAEDARLEDRMHFELMTPRVYELDGRLPNNIRDFADMAVCPAPFLPKNRKDPRSILEALPAAERCS